jgi:DNA polymerase-3 subunit gamma/tau
VEVADQAIAMIARAADGSVRDGLSLLDQAIALSGGGKVEAEAVRAMLGLADRARVFDLFEALMKGAAPEALALLAEMHVAGAEPAVVIQDLLELSHTLTRGKLVPETLEEPGMPETERVRGRALAEKLTMPVLSRVWQMLLKGLSEVRNAPAQLQAAEMVLIRLTHASDLPTPAELVARLDGEGAPKGGAAAGGAAGGEVRESAGGQASLPVGGAAEPLAPPGDGGTQAALAPQLDPEPAPAPEPAKTGPRAQNPESFEAVIELARSRGEQRLANHLIQDVHLLRFEPGRIELNLGKRAPARLAGQLGEFLQQATNTRWMVTVSSEEGAPTLGEQARAKEAALREAALAHPLVSAAMEAFPGAKLVARRDTGAKAGEAAGEDKQPAPDAAREPAPAGAPQDGGDGQP